MLCFLRIQSFLPLPPIGHIGVHERLEVGAVVGDAEVAELVENDVVDALLAFLGEQQRKPNFTRSRVAGAPARVHIPNRKVARVQTRSRLPRGQTLGDLLPQGLAPPFAQKRAAPLGGAEGTEG